MSDHVMDGPTIMKEPIEDLHDEDVDQSTSRTWWGRVGFILASTWLVGLVLAAVLADLLPIRGFADPSSERSLSPGFRLDEPLGTDSLGRSHLSRLFYGARISFGVAAISVAISMTIGGIMGMLAGYTRSFLERAVDFTSNVLLAFPPLFLLLAITAIFRQSAFTLIAGLAIVTIPPFARLARANTLAISQREFVKAARAIGARTGRILLREITPNILLPMVSYGFLLISVVIVAEGSLSFLGLGIPPPQPSWGGMIEAGRPRLASHPHLVFVPASFLVLTILAVNVVGDQFARRFNVKSSALQ